MDMPLLFLQGLMNGLPKTLYVDQPDRDAAPRILSCKEVSERAKKHAEAYMQVGACTISELNALAERLNSQREAERFALTKALRPDIQHMMDAEDIARRKRFGAFVYVMGTENLEFKIGWSKNPHVRRYSVVSPSGNRVVVLHSIRCSEPHDPLIVERLLHALFAHKRISGEWFSLSHADICWLQSMQEWGAVKECGHADAA